jgi:hypothetical protein
MTARVLRPWAPGSRGGPPRSTVIIRPDRVRVFEALCMPEPNTGCVLWAGRVNQKGYGQFYTGRTTAIAHRVAYQLARGAIPPGLCVCHRCDVPSCVNPEHLFPGTIEDNNKDMARTGLARGADNGRPLKQVCKRGHSLSAGDVRTVTKASGHVQRNCRACERARRTAKRSLVVASLPANGRDLCWQGHELVGSNLIRYRNGTRECRLCRNNRAKSRRLSRQSPGGTIDPLGADACAEASE